MGDNRIYGGRFGQVVQADRIDSVHFHVQEPRTRAPAWRLRVVAAGLACGGAALYLLGPRHLAVASADAVRLTGLVCLAVALCTASAALWELRAGRRPVYRPSAQELDRAVEELARVLRAQYERDERLSRIHDPSPIPVRWTAADPLLTDHWRNIRRAARGPEDDASAADRPVDVTGAFDEIAGFFTSLPAQRLVVLGGPGAGKSVLALHLAHDLVAARGPASAAPVPVVFPLASWDPKRRGLWNWAAARLTADHPTVLAAPGDATHALALELIVSGRVLPVLDGFDELPPAAQADALRELRASLSGPARFLVTSRTEEYAAAVEAGNTVLPSAVVVELQPLSADEVASYLPRTARRTSRDNGSRTAWEPVLRRLDDPADRSREVRVLRAVLSTPLMIALARVAYSDGDAGADPAELLSAGRFTTRGAVERHLFDTFVSAAYGGSLDDRVARPGWGADDARRWAGFLARHLRGSGAQDFEWWRLDEAVPRAVRSLATVPALVLIVLTFHEAGFGAPWWQKAVGLPMGAAAAVVAAIVLVGDWAVVEPGSLPGPHRIDRPSGARLRAAFLTRQGMAKAAFVLLGLAVGSAAATMLSSGFTRTLVVLVTAWLALHWAARAVNSLRRPADPAEATEPSVLLIADRKASMVLGAFEKFRPGTRLEQHEMLFGAPVFSAAVWLLIEGGEVIGPDQGVRAGAGLVSAAALYGMAVSAWGRYTVARLWLALTGRLPWRLMAFLRDAHARGVLRQVGGLYRFRHIELRNRLARTSGPDPEPARAPRFRLLRPALAGLSGVALAGVLVLGSGALNMVPPVPYEAVPRACSLLDDRLLSGVMSDPLKVAHGRASCSAGEQSPFHRDVSIGLNTFVTRGQAGPGMKYLPATRELRRTPGYSRTLLGLGDEAVEGFQLTFPTHMEGPQHMAVLSARVANVVLKLTYTEEFAKEPRARDVARILMRAALRHAHLTPTRHQSGRRSLADVPRAGLPEISRLTLYDPERHGALAGARWGKDERSHLWIKRGYPFVLRAPKYIACKQSGRDNALTCTSDPPKGLHVPRLRLTLADLDCPRRCSDNEIKEFFGRRPRFATTPWKRVDRTLWYAEDTGEAGTYRMLLARTLSYGSRGQGLIWAEAEVATRDRALAQKIINDIYAQTGAR
ncbi:NACHT domain-containing protein [Streptomyces sp. NPDC002004]